MIQHSKAYCHTLISPGHRLVIEEQPVSQGSRQREISFAHGVLQTDGSPSSVPCRDADTSQLHDLHLDSVEFRCARGFVWLDAGWRRQYIQGLSSSKLAHAGLATKTAPTSRGSGGQFAVASDSTRGAESSALWGRGSGNCASERASFGASQSHRI